jgi:TPR repeat protein
MTTIAVIVVSLAVSADIGSPGARASEAFHADSAAQTEPDTATRERLVRTATAGDPRAQLALGVLYDTGAGVLQDPVVAVGWFRKAAEQQLPEAEFQLGLAYALGRGVAPSDREAAEWFLKAGEQGLARAQYMAGLAYQAGKGVYRDVLAGIDWQRKAAAQGFAPAQFAVGITFRPTTEGMSIAGTIDLMRKAAAQGWAPAQLRLGKMLVMADDLPLADPTTALTRDYVEAYVWFDVCARRLPSEEELRLDSWVPIGVFAATVSCGEERNDLYGKMTPEQLSTAQTQALAWLTDHEPETRK